MRETVTALPGQEQVPAPRRRRALGVLALVQLMLILDTTVVNVALPSIRDGLGFSAVGLAWVVNGYALASGGLLVLGGRLGDLLGRRRIFLIGVAVFAAASLLCAVAMAPWQLVVGRFAQGAGGALAAPAALALVSLLFPEPRERARALALWGGLAGVGGTAGVLLSGILTDLAGWRWVFLINLPVAAVALVLVPRWVAATAPATHRPRLDLLGAALVTGGLVLVIDGVLRAAETGWGDTGVVVRLGLGAVAVAVFVVVEARTAAPLVPLGFFRNRTRVTAYAATAVTATSMAATFYLVTLHLQGVLGWTPLQIGLAWVPFGVAMVAGVSLAATALRLTGLRGVLATGFTSAAGGMFLLGRLGETAGYAADVLPGTLLLAFGTGLTFPAIQVAALHATTAADAGLASGVQATLSHLGGSVGLAVFVALSVGRFESGTAAGESIAVATSAGHATAFQVGGATLLAGALLALAFARTPTTPGPETST